MAFCNVCGNETKVEVILCPKCNTSQVNYQYKIVKLKDEKLAWLWLIPSCIFPLFGFLAFIFLGYGRPKSSFYTLIGTVVGSFLIFTYVAVDVISTVGIF